MKAVATPRLPATNPPSLTEDPSAGCVCDFLQGYFRHKNFHFSSARDCFM